MFIGANLTSHLSCFFPTSYSFLSAAQMRHPLYPMHKKFLSSISASLCSGDCPRVRPYALRPLPLTPLVPPSLLVFPFNTVRHFTYNHSQAKKRVCFELSENLLFRVLFPLSSLLSLLSPLSPLYSHLRS